MVQRTSAMLENEGINSVGMGASVNTMKSAYAACINTPMAKKSDWNCMSGN